jgi:peptidoglycan/xylan/chitin deacetylase (PgdA/CDA1 family)
LRLLEWWGRRPCLLVLAYHRIGRRDGHVLDDGVLSATPEDFAAQVDYLSRHFDLPRPEALVLSAQNGLELSRPTALITFDDGYQDNVDCALPILENACVPALFFICPRFVGSRHLPYWDQLAYVLKQAERSFAVDYPFPYQVDLDRVPRPTAILHYLEALAQWPQRLDEERLLAHVEERSGVQVPVETLLDGLFASWDGVRRLVAAGMSIGSHSLTHADLALLSEAEQCHELVQSKTELEQQVGCPVSTVAYPYGHQTDLTRRLAREAGYRLGFSYGGGMNGLNHPDPHGINRVAVDADVVWPQFRARLACYRALGRPVF